MKTMNEASVVYNDEDYYTFESIIRQRVESVEGPVFTTDANPDALWEAYLSGFPTHRRQHYTCSACKHFVRHYGGLVRIDSDLWPSPLLWTDGDGTPLFFWHSVMKLRQLVTKAKVNGVFLWGKGEAEWGTPLTRVNPKADGVTEWSHLSGSPKCKCWSHPLYTAHQKAAALKEDYGILSRSLAEYGPDVVAQALRVLDSGTIYRSEKALGVAQWVDALHKQVAGLKGERRNNALWLAVATAPEGFCHLRTTVISTLLDDIKAGYSFDAISRRWKEKMDPLQYQRPTKAPTEGAIQQAEKVFAAMGAESALRRRYATLNDVQQFLWHPEMGQELEKQTKSSTPTKKSAEVFDTLRKQPTKAPEVSLPTVAITFDKFRRTVLPYALSMEVDVPYTGAFYGLLTAADPTAVPIHQWDGLEGQVGNPVSHYFYSGGSTASHWHLSSGWTEVTGVFLSPHQWQQPEKFTHHKTHAFFALKGCWDDKAGSLCLFPETLKASFHPVRSVIEAYSNKGRPEGAEAGNANGIALENSGEGHVTVRVRTATGTATYKIDRWD